MSVIALSSINRAVASIPLLIFCIFAFQVVKEVVVPRAERWITGTYIAVTNFVVSGSDRGDIDLIVIGPMGVLVVEVKTATSCMRTVGRGSVRRTAGSRRLKKNPSA